MQLYLHLTCTECKIKVRTDVCVYVTLRKLLREYEHCLYKAESAAPYCRFTSFTNMLDVRLYLRVKNVSVSKTLFKIRVQTRNEGAHPPAGKHGGIFSNKTWYMTLINLGPNMLFNQGLTKWHVRLDDNMALRTWLNANANNTTMYLIYSAQKMRIQLLLGVDFYKTSSFQISFYNSSENYFNVWSYWLPLIVKLGNMTYIFNSR